MRSVSRKAQGIGALVLAGVLGATGIAGVASADVADVNDSTCSQAAGINGSVNTSAERFLYLKCRDDQIDRAIAGLGGTVSPSTTIPTISTNAPTSASPTTTPTAASPSPTRTTASPTPTVSSPSPSGVTVLNLPVDPTYVGNDWYAQFANAKDFAREDVYPVGIFYGNCGDAASCKYRVDHGINFSVEGQDAAKASGDYTGQICFTTDELDGRNSDRSAVVAEMRQRIKACSDAGRAPYTNYTGLVTSDYGSTNNAYFKQLLNLGGITSVDGYYFTDPSCDSADRKDYQLNAPDNAHCRSGASYGQFIDTLRARDDAPYQPHFGFVDDGAPAQNGKYITPAQLDGAVWSVVTNGGAPIYFDNSFSGDCQSSGVLQSAYRGQKGNGGRDCYGAIAAQMQATNAAVQSQARVLNSPTYTWDFKAGKTDTMLKALNGQAYVFAAVGLNGDAGLRTFTLPAGISDDTVSVVGEGRTIPVVGGKFTDTFAANGHHEYQLTI